MKRNLYFIASIIIFALLIKIFIFSSQDSKEKHLQDFIQDYKVYALNLPKEITFAEEPVPLNQQDIRERLDRELLVNTYWQSQTLLFIKRANKWFPIIEPILEEYGIPEDFKYIPLIESSLLNKTSPSGAVGFWQFLSKTAKSFGLEVNNEVDERYDVKKSTKAACKYLKDAYKVFGDWTLCAASYNMGVYGVQKQLKRQKVSSYYDLLLNIETNRYVFRIIAVKEILSNPKKYGFHYMNYHLYPPPETYIVRVDSTIEDFVEFAKQHNINYKILKIYNPWLRQSNLKNKARKVYNIEIPVVKSKDLGENENKVEENISFGNIDSTIFSREDSLVYHVVGRGENIFKIAKKHQVKVAQIMQWNNLGDYYVKRGQSLIIYLEKTNIE